MGGINRALDAFELPICRTRPPWRSGTSAWTEHVPFAMNLVAAIRPRTIVELGTDAGDSYRAFCEAVRETGLGTRCFAVGPWRGDAQAASAPAASAELHAQHAARYGAFSRLLRSTPEDAVAQFADGSIDLLHLDGFHTDEAVRHALDTWRAKLSDRGVVLLHGVHAGAGDSGATRAWQELSREYPSFEFLHGQGLGVLAVGAEVPPALRPVVEASEEDRTSIRAFFSELGHAVATPSTDEGRQPAASLASGTPAAPARPLLRSAYMLLVHWNTNPRLRSAVLALLKDGTLPRRAASWAFARATKELDARLYRRWLSVNAVGPQDAPRLHAAASRLEYQPVVSIITPVHDVDARWLRRCLDSVLQQAYGRWELCVVDDASTKPHVGRILAEYARRDPRIRTRRLERNAGIAAASAEALSMATGEFVAFLDHDDELSRDALLEVVAALQHDRDADVVYSDEDKLDGRGRRVEPFFKPDWSPDLLLSTNYICHLAVIRRTLVEEAGGFRPGFDGSQDYDLFLRVTERTRRIVHVPKVLYHWRNVPGSAAADSTAKPYAIEAGRRALESALARRGIDAAVEMPHPGLFHVRYAIARKPTVSIIIPTRDRADLLRMCISSLDARTAYPHREVIVVDNGSKDPDALAYLAEVKQRHRVLEYPHVFNWSSINNFAARQATGDFLLFLNNDIEFLDAGWLDAMVEHAQRPEVGAVGAKLLYPSGRIQHAGVVLGIGGIANHVFKNQPGDSYGYFGFAQVVRNVSAVTGACMLVRRSVFEQVGGFDELLRVAFNDIDFCLKLGKAGYSVVYTPFAVVRHHESATRGSEHPPDSDARMRARWGSLVRRDPFYNPNLTHEFEDYRVRY